MQDRPIGGIWSFRTGPFVFALVLAATQARADLNHLVPVPVSLTVRSDTFTVPAQVWIFSDGAVSDSSVCWVKKLFDQLHVANPSSYDTAIHVADRSTAHIRLLVVTDSVLGSEGYRLTIARDSITIAARTATGQFYGIQTIRQMLPPQIENGSTIVAPQRLPGCSIIDYPRFVHRGFMLDVSRHFFNMTYLRQLVDRIALFKCNILHLHLSDDQGWRIRISPPASATGATVTAYNNLTYVGGQYQVGGPCQDCYFTQEQLRDSLVRYALERKVNIIPEIDMPGHTQAAIASFAKAGITISGNCFAPCTTVYQGTGVGGSNLLTNPIPAVVDTFMQTVWTQLAAVFPYEYMHIGGDESGAPAYDGFIRRLEAIVNGLGRKVVGWEEIYGHTSDPTSLTQTWNYDHDYAGSIYSVRNYCYFDYDPPDGALGYAYYARNMDPNHRGVEGALWTEHISPENGFADRNTWPRQTALAEVGWSSAATVDWTTFKARLQPFGCRFACLGMANWYPYTDVAWQTCSGDSSALPTNALSNYDWQLIPVSDVTGAGHARMPASAKPRGLAQAGYRAIDVRGRVVSSGETDISGRSPHSGGLHFLVGADGRAARRATVE